LQEQGVEVGEASVSLCLMLMSWHMVQKGFIPIVIAVIIGLFVVAGTGYIGIKQYQSNKIQTTPKEEVTKKATENDVVTQAEEQIEELQMSESSEIQKLKEEVEKLKKQQQPTRGQENLSEIQELNNANIIAQPVVPNTPVNATVHTPTPEKNDDDIHKINRETLILMYAKRAEDLKRTIESTNIDINDLKDRRSHLENTIQNVKSIHFTDDGGDGSILNEMFSLYQQALEKELKFVNDNLAYINAILKQIESWQKTYNSLASSLLANPRTIVTSEALANALQKEADENTPNIYKAKKDILNALSRHYESVISNEDQYAESATIIKSALAKVSGPTNVSTSNYYRPMPQSDSGLTTRQQLLLNPIQCEINYDPIRTNVTCY
jgi:hypothetical protein